MLGLDHLDAPSKADLVLDLPVLAVDRHLEGKPREGIGYSRYIVRIVSALGHRGLARNQVDGVAGEREVGRVVVADGQRVVVDPRNQVARIGDRERAGSQSRLDDVLVGVAAGLRVGEDVARDDRARSRVGRNRSRADGVSGGIVDQVPGTRPLRVGLDLGGVVDHETEKVAD